MILAHGSVFHFNRRVTSGPKNMESRNTSQKVEQAARHMSQVALAENASATILYSLNLLYPLPYPVRQSSNCRDTPYTAKKKNIPSKAQSSPFCFASCLITVCGTPLSFEPCVQCARAGLLQFFSKLPFITGFSTYPSQEPGYS